MTGLSPGRYGFVFGIRIGGQVEPIKTFEDIAIVSGPNPPPGLPGEAFVADLRGLVRLYTLFVHDFGGKRVEARFEVLYESETFWLNKKKIAGLFGVDLRTINEHLKNIFTSGEMTREATLRKIRRVQREGNREASRESSRPEKATQACDSVKKQWQVRNRWCPLTAVGMASQGTWSHLEQGSP